MKNYPVRHSPRLQGYDYSQNGAYFITVCTQNRKCLFGTVSDGEMQLNTFGRIVHRYWQSLPYYRLNLELDLFVVMPNHTHAIVLFFDNGKPKQAGLPEITRGLKTFSAKEINAIRDATGTPVWQRSYHDRIIRNEQELNRIREYILLNSARWEKDDHYSV